MKKSLLVDQDFPGYNCAQTVFSLFAPDLGLNKETSLRIASGFGGGMNAGETCGAVTGAYLVIGLKAGHSSKLTEDKNNTTNLIKTFNRLFTQETGSLKCKKLLGYDITKPEEYAAAKEANVFLKKCPEYLKIACNIIEKMDENQLF